MAIGQLIQETIFLSAGNITHTPLYGHLIALGVLTAAETRDAGPHAANAMAYRDRIADTGRFLTFCGGAAVIGQRMQPDPKDRCPSNELVRTTRAWWCAAGWACTQSGLRGGRLCRRPDRTANRGHPAGFIVPVNAPGVTVLCRKAALRDGDPFVSPLSSRYDEFDGQMWLDDVFIPWEMVFAVDPEPEAIPRWLRWHHLRGWLAKAEFSLGLALALTDAMGLKQHDATVEYVVDLMAEVQTVRSCLTAAELDPEFTPTGYCVPQSCAFGGRRHRAVQSAPADVGNSADFTWLVAGGGADRQRSGPARSGGGTGGGVWRWRLYGAATLGAAETGVGSRVVCARRARVSV